GLLHEIQTGLDDDKGRVLFAQVEEARSRYVEAFGRARTFLAQGKSDDGRAFAVSEVVPRLAELKQAWSLFFAYENEQMVAAATESARNYATARETMFALVIVSVLAAVLMALGVTRSIARPIA